MTKGSDPLGMKVWVTPPGQLPTPAKAMSMRGTWREMMVPVAALRPTAATEAVVYVTNLSLVSFPRKKEP